MQITFTIPDPKVARVIDAVKGLFPVPEDENGVPLFTDAQWAKEKIRRHIVSTVHRYELKVAQDTARDSVLPDDNIVS